MHKKIKIDTDNNIGASENKSSFEETGISKFKMNINIKVTQKDMEMDLIQKSEGKFIKPKLNENNN